LSEKHVDTIFCFNLISFIRAHNLSVLKNVCNELILMNLYMYILYNVQSVDTGYGTRCDLM